MVILECELMIRNNLFLILILFTLFACNNDKDAVFDVPVEFVSLSFDAVPGGAVMRYQLPDNADIFGVRVRYLGIVV